MIETTTRCDRCGESAGRFGGLQPAGNPELGWAAIHLCAGCTRAFVEWLKQQLRPDPSAKTLPLRP